MNAKGASQNSRAGATVVAVVQEIIRLAGGPLPAAKLLGINARVALDAAAGKLVLPSGLMPKVYSALEELQAEHADPHQDAGTETKTKDRLSVLMSRYECHRLRPTLPQAKIIRRDAHGAPLKPTTPTFSKRYRSVELEFEGIEGLARLLERVKKWPRAMIVRGELREDQDTSNHRRTLNPGEDGQATFCDVGRCWAMIDIDSPTKPPHLNEREQPEELARWVVKNCLPKEFHDVDFYFAYSASAATKGVDKIKIHLWFLFDRELTSADWKIWCKTEAADSIDPSVLTNAIQPHFIGIIFKDCEDHLPKRSGVLKGSKRHVSLVIDPNAPRGKKRGGKKGTTPPGGGANWRAPTFEAALVAFGDQSQGKKGYHDPLHGAIRQSVSGKHLDDIDRVAIRQQIIDAMTEAAEFPGDRGVSAVKAAYFHQIDNLLDWYMSPLRSFVLGHVSEPTYKLAPLPLEHSRQLVGDDLDGSVGITAAWMGEEARKDSNVREKRNRRARAERRIETGQVEHPAADGLVELSKLTPEQLSALADFIDAGQRVTREPHEPPPLFTLKVPTGVGKTEAIIKHVVKYGGTYGFFVPTLDLVDDIQARIEAEGISVGVIRGRSAENPVGKGEMCGRLDLVSEIAKYRLPVTPTCCINKTRRCPLYDQCAYMAQFDCNPRPQVWLMAHNYLFLEKPDALGDLDGIIVDEDFWQTAIDSGPPGSGGLRVPFDVIADGDEALMRQLHRARRGYMRPQLMKPLKIMAAGRRQQLWQNRPLTVWGGGNENDRKAHLQTLCEAAFWDEVRKADPTSLAGRLRLDDGAVLVKQLKSVRTGWRIPAYLLSATMERDIVELVMPEFDPQAPLEIDAVEQPHVCVRQVVDKSFSLTSLAGKDFPAKVGLLIELINKAGSCLTISPMAFEKQYLDGVPSLHFNALAGLDSWGDVEKLVLVSRPLPKAAHIAEMASILDGRGRVVDNPTQEMRGIAMTDGGVAGVQNPVFRDNLMETIRRNIVEGSVVQGLGRARGVNRDANSPLEVTILTNQCLPILVDKVVRWEDIKPSRLDRQAATGVWLDNAADIAKVWPKVFKNEQAVKDARRRDPAKFPPPSDAVVVRYTLPGERKTRRAWFCPRTGPKPRTFLRKHFGSWVEVVKC